MDSKIKNCEIGRNMEINMAKVITKIENMEKDQERQRNERREIKQDVKTILQKFDLLDEKYASKEEVEFNEKRIDGLNSKINWASTFTISTLVGVIMFLLTKL